jgi:hypothetical protein
MASSCHAVAEERGRMTDRRTGAFAGIDFDGFWDDGAYSLESFTEPAPTEALIAEVEAELGFRLPDAYVELAMLRNGGCVERSCYPMDEPTSWADDHLAITGISAIGRTARYSLLGQIGSPFMQGEWGYPIWGVVFTSNPSAGHDVLMLDYRACGPQGEPRVAHVDQESDYAVTAVADDFAAFIRGLVVEEEFMESDEELTEEALTTVRRGTLSPIVRRALQACSDDLPDGERLVRALGERIVISKAGFHLHADGDSWLMYDLMFWLYSRLAVAASFEDFFKRGEGQLDYELPCFELMVTTSFVAAPYGFHTAGFAEGFLRDWWDAKLAAGSMVGGEDGYRMEDAYAVSLIRVLRAVATAQDA